jgi:hypothetical protein
VQVIPENAGTETGAGISAAQARADVAAIERIGRHPVVLAPNASALVKLGNGSVNLVFSQATSIDEHVIFGTPRNTLPQVFSVYSWEPAK